MNVNLEAFIAIGALCVALGSVLLIFGLWWAKYKAKTDPVFGRKASFTPVGWISLLVMVLVLLGGFGMQHFAPQSYIGKLTSTGLGRLLWTALTFGFFLVTQKILVSFGIFIQKHNRREEDL